MKAKRLILPVGIFAAVWAIHFFWLVLFPENSASAQDQWVSFETTAKTSAWTRYLSGRNYFLSYTYALSLSFAAVSFRRYREKRHCATGRVAFGSLGLSGILGVGGCFLIGCCGSPMLGVYLSFFGAGVLSFAKPLVAALTTLMIGASWLWLLKSERQPVSLNNSECGCDPNSGS